MKRIILIAATVLLVAAGCVEDNPFNADSNNNWQGGESHPHIIQQATLSGGSGSHELNDCDPGVEGIQDAIILTFDQAMDPATVTASAFVLESTGGGGTQITPDNVVYVPEERTVSIYATFERETAYMIKASAGASLNLAGLQLDPNYNALYDGPPWDDSRFTFHNGSAEEADITPPELNSHWPTGGGQTGLLPEIAVVFGAGPMDVSTLTTGNFYLVRTSDSSNVEVRVTIATGSQMSISPVSDLAWGERYTVRLKAKVADSSGNLIDLPPNAHVWPDEPDFTWDFQMADDENTHKTPPTVESATLSGNRITVFFQESLTGEYVNMDSGTFTSSNIQLIDETGAIPLEFQTGSFGDRVFCYLERPVNGVATIFVSAMVRDEYGNYLDGNKDGLGGTPGIDDWARSF